MNRENVRLEYGRGVTSLEAAHLLLHETLFEDAVSPPRQHHSLEHRGAVDSKALKFPYLSDENRRHRITIEELVL